MKLSVRTFCMPPRRALKIYHNTSTNSTNSLLFRAFQAFIIEGDCSWSGSVGKAILLLEDDRSMLEKQDRGKTSFWSLCAQRPNEESKKKTEGFTFFNAGQRAIQKYIHSERGRRYPKRVQKRTIGKGSRIDEC